MNKITIDNITEQQLEDMIKIIRSIESDNDLKDYYYEGEFKIKWLTLRAQETFKLIRNQ